MWSGLQRSRPFSTQYCMRLNLSWYTPLRASCMSCSPHRCDMLFASQPCTSLHTASHWYYLWHIKKVQGRLFVMTDFQQFSQALANLPRLTWFCYNTTTFDDYAITFSLAKHIGISQQCVDIPLGRKSQPYHALDSPVLARCQDLNRMWPG